MRVKIDRNIEGSSKELWEKIRDENTLQNLHINICQVERSYIHDNIYKTEGIVIVFLINRLENRINNRYSVTTNIFRMKKYITVFRLYAQYETGRVPNNEAFTKSHRLIKSYTMFINTIIRWHNHWFWNLLFSADHLGTFDQRTYECGSRFDMFDNQNTPHIRSNMLVVGSKDYNYECGSRFDVYLIRITPSYMVEHL